MPPTYAVQETGLMKTMAHRVMACLVVLGLTVVIDVRPLAAQGPDSGEGITWGQALSTLNPLNWQMPRLRMPSFRSMLPNRDEKARIVEKKRGFFSEVSKTASNSWQRTKAALSPKNLNPVRFMPASSRTPSTSSSEPAKPGFFRSLFMGPEPTPEPETVTDFLRQDRLQ